MKKALKKAAAGLALTVAFAGAAEWNGYRPLDRPDGGNILCQQDKSCRVLTPGEIALAQGVFGDSVDYRHVKIFARPWYGVPLRNVSAMVPNGDIYITSPGVRAADYSAPDENPTLFMHEMTHVWQYQHGMSTRLGALKELVRNRFNYDAVYNFSLKGGEKFANLSMEQQAVAVENYISNRNILNNLLSVARDPRRHTLGLHYALAGTCQEIKQDEAVIGEFLPLRPEANCPLPADLPPVLSNAPKPPDFSTMPRGRPTPFGPAAPPPFLPSGMFR